MDPWQKHNPTATDLDEVFFNTAFCKETLAFILSLISESDDINNLLSHTAATMYIQNSSPNDEKPKGRMLLETKLAIVILNILKSANQILADVPSKEKEAMQCIDKLLHCEQITLHPQYHLLDDINTKSNFVKWHKEGNEVLVQLNCQDDGYNSFIMNSMARSLYYDMRLAVFEK